MDFKNSFRQRFKHRLYLPLTTIIIIIFSFFTKVTYADNKGYFETQANVEYKVQENGLTLVTNTISIKNLKSELYAKKYTLNLSGFTPENVKAYEEGVKLEVNQEKNAEKTKLTVNFNNPSVGKDNTKTFIISYEERSLVSKSGEIWEVVIPKLENYEDFQSYKVILSVPVVFGEEAYISPEPREARKVSERKIYIFEKEDIFKSGITAGFGKFQVFSFSIDYFLEETDQKKKEVEVAIPPDTTTQKMFYISINPQPKNIKLDEDSNWIAIFDIPKNRKISVKVEGFVQIFASPRKINPPAPSTFLTNTRSTAFWQSNDPEIKNIANSLKSAKEIYEFVSTNLSYNYQRIEENPKRLGAKEAINRPQEALCMEFTDLFIALSRAKGIPAREINGYAYSQNQKLEPIPSSNLLHSWPEYWDETKQTWVPVDPTWGSTTKGVDFFNKFDLRHFAFVIHGKDPTNPKTPQSYNPPGTLKNFQVSFGTLPKKTNSEVLIYEESKKSIPLLGRKSNIVIENTGPSAIYNLTPEVTLGSLKYSLPTVEVFPPFSKLKENIKITYGLLGTRSPNTFNIKIQNKQVDIETHKDRAIINQLLTLFMSLIVLLFIIHYKLTGNKLPIKFPYKKWRLLSKKS